MARRLHPPKTNPTLELCLVWKSNGNYQVGVLENYHVWAYFIRMVIVDAAYLNVDYLLYSVRIHLKISLMLQFDYFGLKIFKNSIKLVNLKVDRWKFRFFGRIDSSNSFLSDSVISVWASSVLWNCFETKWSHFIRFKFCLEWIIICSNLNYLIRFYGRPYQCIIFSKKK